MTKATAATSLTQRKLREAQQEERIRSAFQDRKRELEAVKRENKQKKKSTDELMGYLSMKGYSLWGCRLREPEIYIPRSHNLNRQLMGLIDHMYVKYPVPDFLYQVFHDNAQDPFNCMRDIYQLWFVTLAQGGSFPKLVKGFMTSKEAATFLKAPPDGKVHGNVWWAKLMVAGVPPALCKTLVERVFVGHYFDDPDGRLAEVVTFYANHHARIGKRDFDEVTDFAAWMLRNEPSFRFKGRTASSVLKLTNEWHLLIQHAKLGAYVEWPGLGYEPWEHVAKTTISEIVELRDNRELMNEGRKQNHCVYSYVSACDGGRSAIVSLRVYHKCFTGSYNDRMEPQYDKSCELSRVTIEVNQNARQIVQVRGRQNWPPSDDESKLIKLWAGEKGLTISPYCR